MVPLSLSSLGISLVEVEMYVELQLYPLYACSADGRAKGVHYLIYLDNTAEDTSLTTDGRFPRELAQRAL
jgi:hypothetical protein